MFATTVFCLFLVLLLSFGQAVHIHSGASDADHCPICLVLHATPTVAVAAAVVVVVQVATPVPVQQFRSVYRPWHSSYFTRPPPASC